jgi:glyoxylase-like metal-dependent hydrolase (beta-lactamase superfamily II)
MAPRDPILSTVAPGITAVDTGMIGERELNSVYFIAAAEPTLIETGPGADGSVVRAALSELGVDAGDLAHILVTHIHIDHAGGAGSLLRQFPRATLWAHERGVPHLVDPTRLIASTARTYGPQRMTSFFGVTEPVPPGRVRPLDDGDRIDLGDRVLTVIHTPGHASHHVAFHDDGSDAILTGEAIGSFLPWGPAYRPALPPPEVDVLQAIASIDRIGALHPTTLLTSHFGAIPAGEDGCALARDGVISWSETVRRTLEADRGASQEDLAESLGELADRSFASTAGRPLSGAESARYDALGSIAMNAAGLSRYWSKRWESEEGGAR